MQDILYSDMEHVEAYENELEYEDGHADSTRKGSYEMVTAADMVEPLEVDPSHSAGDTDDEEDNIDLLDDDI